MSRSASGAGARRSLPAPENQQHDDNDDDQEHDSSAYVHAGTSLVRGCDHWRMSNITDVLLVTGITEDDAPAQVNAWLTEHDSRKQQLNEIGLDGSGGIKVSCVRLWAAAFNCLDVCGLVEAIMTAPWDLPPSVVAYFDLDDSGQDTFVVSPARPGRWTTRPCANR
jgi:hypothetical protein